MQPDRRKAVGITLPNYYASGVAVMAKKDALYELSYETGATKSDSWIDATRARTRGSRSMTTTEAPARASRPAHAASSALSWDATISW